MIVFEPRMTPGVAVPRHLWLRGAGSQLLDDRGLSCVMGHVLRFFGASPYLLARSPSNPLSKELELCLGPFLSRRLNEPPSVQRRETPSPTRLSAIITFNDLPDRFITAAAREENLIELFQEAFLDIVFKE